MPNLRYCVVSVVALSVLVSGCSGDNGTRPTPTSSTATKPTIAKGANLDKYGHPKVSVADLKPIARNASPAQIAQQLIANCNVLMALASQSTYEQNRGIVIAPGEAKGIGMDGIIEPEIKAWAKNRLIVLDSGTPYKSPMLTIKTLGTPTKGKDADDDPAIAYDGLVLHLYDDVSRDEDLDNNGVPTVLAYKTGIMLNGQTVSSWVIVRDEQLS